MYKLTICLLIGLVMTIFPNCGHFASNEKMADDNSNQDEPEEVRDVPQPEPVPESDFPDDGTVIDILDDILPQPDELVPFDKEPRLLVAPDPEYPEMALKAGIEGAVWVKLLVDKEGNVRDAIIVKESGMGVGFEEASITAAWKRKYRLALLDGKPVAVWVAYRVRFALKDK